MELNRQKTAGGDCVEAYCRLPSIVFKLLAHAPTTIVFAIVFISLLSVNLLGGGSDTSLLRSVGWPFRFGTGGFISDKAVAVNGLVIFFSEIRILSLSRLVADVIVGLVVLVATSVKMEWCFGDGCIRPTYRLKDAFALVAAVAFFLALPHENGDDWVEVARDTSHAVIFVCVTITWMVIFDLPGNLCRHKANGRVVEHL
jgi:hypothetical protein